MAKKTSKKTLPILVGILIVALIVSIIPSNFMAEASNGPKEVKNPKIVSKVVAKEYIKLEKAIEIALKKVRDKKAEVTDIEISLTYKEPHYIIEISTKSHIYKVKIDGITGKVINVEKNKIKEDNTNKVTFISKYEAKTIALNKVNNNTANIAKFAVELKRDVPHYLVSIVTSTHQYIMKINAKTGEAYDLEIFVKDPSDNLYYFDNNKRKGTADKVYEYYRSKYYKENNIPVDTKYITKDEAIKKALVEIGKDATLDKVEFKKDEDTPRYEIKMYDKDYKYKVELHAVTGQVLKYKKEIIKDKDKNPPVVGVKYITKEEAIKKALERIGRDAKVEEIEFEKNSNPPRYEIEMYNNDYEYEIEVHAITGAILKFDKDEN